MSVGPPPHFAAAWAPTGILIDVSRMGALRQRISLNLTDVPIDTAVAIIREQAQLHLLYRGGILPAGRKVSLQVKDITVASALAEVLLDTGLDVMMTRGGHLGFVECPHLPAVLASENGVVTGRVSDRATGAPLAGATVMVEGTRLAATANAEGRYRLVGLPAGLRIVLVRSIGYTPASDTVFTGPRAIVRDYLLDASAQPLEQVVVTGTLIPTEVKALPTPITIITADDIRRQNVTRITQLFRGQAAGAFAWDRAADDHYHTISVRGATSLSRRSIKTFIDGIEVADPQFAALVDPNSVDRIELTRGPQASTMYGSDAIGGVLQIFTKKGAFEVPRPGGEIKSSVSLLEKNDGPGVAPRFEDAVTVRGGERRTRYHVAGYYRRDGEWTPSYQNVNWSITASGENIHGPLTTRITGVFARKMYHRPWFTALRDSGYVFFSKLPFEAVDLQVQTYGVNFVYAATPRWRHDLVLGYDRWVFGMTQTERRLTTPADTLLQVIMNQRGKMSIFYYTTVDTKFNRAITATISAGFNHYDLDGSDVFGTATNAIAGALDGPMQVSRLPSTNSGYFAQGQVGIAKAVFLTAGLRAEKSPGFGKDIGTVLSPRFGASYVHPIGAVALKLRMAYGESTRAPEPSQNQSLSAAGFEQLANSALRPERQRGGDGGLDLYWGSRASLSVTYYNQNAFDLIDRVFGNVVGDPPRQQTQQQNVGKIRNRGWEVEAQYSLDRMQVSGAFSVTSSRIRELDSTYGGNYRAGDRVFNVPRYSAGLTITCGPFSRTMFRGSIASVGDWVDRDLIAFYGPVFGNLPSRPSERDYWVTYPGFTKFRVGVEQKLWKGMSGTFDVENATNKRVFETHNLDVPSPRVFALALRASY